MNIEQAVEILRGLMSILLMIISPILLVVVFVGLVVSLIQSATSIQEQTLSFVPKLIAVGATMLVALPWMLQLLVEYTANLLRSLPGYVG
jgi:flagellar biosynthetic protein FliQ